MKSKNDALNVDREVETAEVTHGHTCRRKFCQLVRIPPVLLRDQMLGV